MSKLFIIGNGFDLAHKLSTFPTDDGKSTSYRDFRNWLIKEYDLKETTIDKLKETLSQNYDFDQIIDDLEEKLLTENFELYEDLNENREESQKFMIDAAREWYEIMENQMPNEKKEAYLNGMAKDTVASKSTEQGQKEAFLNGLKEANYESLLKVLEKIEDEEWNQDNYDKALKEILKNDFGFELDGFIKKTFTELDYSKIYNITPETSEIIANIIVVAIDATTKKWEEFESKLGSLNLDLFVEQKDDENDDEFRLEMEKMLYHTILLNKLPEITKFFKKWINTIDVAKWKSKEKFKDELKKGKCLFFNFNYTDTLELLYGVENICHIHGTKDKEIILGHEESADFSDFDKKMFKTTFKKLTGWCISNNKEFFSSLKDVSEIYSIGFSFGEVDMPYIKEIIQNIDTETITWYLNKFDENNNRNETFRGKIYKELEELKTEGKGCPKVMFNIFDME